MTSYFWIEVFSADGSLNNKSLTYGINDSMNEILTKLS